MSTAGAINMAVKCGVCARVATVTLPVAVHSDEDTDEVSFRHVCGFCGLTNDITMTITRVYDEPDA